jgi:hypothetical protein
MPITRRQATGFMLATVGFSLSPKATASGGATGAAIDELKLPSEVLARLEHGVTDVLEDARWLEELPLDGLNPGFVFVPR